MGATARKDAATYADLLAVPNHLVAEILDGDLYATPRPALPHARAASILGASVTGPFDRGVGGPGGWWILHEPELHLARDVVVPDLTGWRRERLPTIPAEPFLSLAPDWLAEIVVDDQRYIYAVDDIRFIIEEAAAAGVKVAAHVWTRAGAHNAIAAGVSTLEHLNGVADEDLDVAKRKGVVAVFTPFPEAALLRMRAPADARAEYAQESIACAARASAA
jgi:hypothetical protein